MATPADAPGAALREAAAAAVDRLEALLVHEDALGTEAATELRGTVEAVRARLARDELVVAVVGEKKAGKSTFLNAVLGARLLGAAVRECTGTVTTIRRGEAHDFTARFEDGRLERFSEQDPGSEREDAEAIAAQRLAIAAFEAEGALPADRALPAPPVEAEAALEAATAALPESLRGPAPASGWACMRHRVLSLWHRKRLAARVAAEAALTTARARWREAVSAALAGHLADLEAQAELRRQERFDRFVASVRRLTDMAADGGTVVALDLDVPSPVLPPGLAILDTPGANTDDARNQARAWKAIESTADGCLLLSDLQQVMSRSTREFLQAVREVVPHVILVLTKQDRALANAAGAEAPEAELEEARRLGVRRFAREMGRAPDDLLALTVAAEPALADGPGSPAAVAFEAEVARLFEVLHLERALLVGARAATALDTCLRRIDEAQARAEAAYAENIALMEAQRIDDPAGFKAAELAAMRPHVREELEAAAAASVHHFHVAWARLETRWRMQVLAAVDRADLQARLGRVTEEWAAALDGLTREAPLVACMSGLARSFSGAAHEALRARYRLAQGGHLVAELPGFSLPDEAGEGLGLQAGLAEAWGAFDADMLVLGVGGAAAGAALGSLVAPGLGTVVGGLVGSLASRLLTLEMLQEDCLEKLVGEMAAVETRARARFEDLDAHTEAVLARVGDRLELAIRAYQAAIEALIAEEASRLAAERARLEDLLETRDALRAAGAALRRHSQEAALSSRGLSAV